MARKVFNNNEIPHLWAHQTQDEARNSQGSLYFRGDTIYSYRDSYPIGRLVKNDRGEEAVLIQRDNYSQTTATHISGVRQATSHMRQFEVTNLRTWQNGIDHEKNLEDFSARYKDALSKVVRARTHRDWALDRLNRVVDQANGYAEFFGLPNRWEVPRDFGDIKAELQRETARQAAAERQRQAELRKAKAEEIQNWLTGKSHYFPHAINETMLRVIGDNVETSKGASVPAEHALRLLEFIERLKASGKSYEHNGHTIHVGHYRVDSINANGDLKAGCHHIKYSEIERFAPILRQEIEKIRSLPAPTIGQEQGIQSPGYERG